MLVLGIESSCDEMATSVVKEGKEILSNVIFSQADLHKQYGGVFPEVACRRHIKDFIPAVKQALLEARVTAEEIDLIAVTKGPGLIGALLIGLNGAKTLSYAWKKPFVGVNHVEAHLYAAMMDKKEVLLPALGVVVSGGHTFLVRIDQLGSYTLLGSTVDDAIGEAFDKVGSLLGLSYPGGPAIEALAKQGDPSLFPFKAGRVKNAPLDFSFSGLKTSVLYRVKGANSKKDSPLIITEEEKAHVAASFQQTALLDIVDKSLKASTTFSCQGIYLGGGVSNNQLLRKFFIEKSALPIYWPPPKLSLDNAAMIAGLGYHLFQKNGGDPLDLSPSPRIPF